MAGHPRWAGHEASHDAARHHTMEQGVDACLAQKHICIGIKGLMASVTSPHHGRGGVG